VGAIAVLFPFVLMLLNIKLAELQQSYSNFIPISIVFSFVFLTKLEKLEKIDDLLLLAELELVKLERFLLQTPIVMILE
jgi:hypothetical protein